MNIVLLDDNPKELEKYSNIFDSSEFAKEHYTLHPILIKELNSNFKFSFKPDLFLIDYRFDLPGGEDSFHDGYVLSTALRNTYLEVPIILFTRKDIFNIQKFPKNIIDIVDDIIYKSDFTDGEDRYFNQIYSIANGYSLMRKISNKKWEKLIELIGVPEESQKELLNAHRPIIKDDKWTIIDSANWIRKTIIKYPGILYDEIYSSTFLGISLDSFKINIEMFQNAIFCGIFATQNTNYYWKTSLRKIAIDLMNKHEIYLPIHLGFIEAFQKEYNKKLEPAICVYSGEANADKVCCILNKPVKTKFSFEYNLDSRPEVMDKARVSWKAIRTTNEVNEGFLNPLAQEMIKKIKSNKSIS